MKSKFAAVLFLSVCSFSEVFGQLTQPPPQINVSGSAEVKVVPNEIRLSVAVETRSETLEPARLENDEKTASVLKFLKQIGIKEKDVQTDFISIQPDYEYNNRPRIVPSAYIVQKSIQVRLTATTNFQAVLTGLLTNGVNRVNGVDFRTTQLRKFRDQARAMAIRAAKEKAQALVSELGVKLGKPYNISATDNAWFGYYGNRSLSFNNQSQNSSNVSASAPSDDSEESFSVGQISVSATSA
ncbi:MAG: SIMPL domain-containing protein [Verrucomicrobiota bacterium]